MSAEFIPLPETMDDIPPKESPVSAAPVEPEKPAMAPTPTPPIPQTGGMRQVETRE